MSLPDRIRRLFMTRSERLYADEPPHVTAAIAAADLALARQRSMTRVPAIEAEIARLSEVVA